MEPFDHIFSLSAVNMSHQRGPDHLITRLMNKLFELLEERHVKPINPIHVSFTGVDIAVRYLRAGKHIAQFVISEGPEPKISASVSFTVRLNGNKFAHCAAKVESWQIALAVTGQLMRNP
ncbi:uncharacterized protein ColSpa_07965 [Colletotrichum spaethianum]|uniref:Uncharacterized protein n=1 Tax=Colletotrichum spaethianum TaxID=700344 RepID=A0AA37P8V4_9PEZI|nr:uncharacterized protein ColSpa_07965 [Colletotrichum spaethianum]GKT47784.1 hypothetical protein ColSpa_07965 [Colletotrichum spaethianum]